MSDEKLKFLDRTYNLLFCNIEFLQIVSYAPYKFYSLSFRNKNCNTNETYRIGLRTGNPKKT